jgi:hypothetical protein
MEKEMTRRSQYEIWVDTFRPVANPRKNPTAGDRTRFETFGADLDQVLAASKYASETVWTMLNTDGQFHIAQGYHFVNRTCYFITEVPFDPDNPDHVRRYQQRDTPY